ncbi:solute carrier family 25 protein Shawn-like [Rhynchophorus ferrugineus]|uniref:solute carrier family 25 protein Shawn-like n=1 Tax=Rhynchophorus ferrugineus TaxID=354439 RepID=UPI003FCDDC69
MLTRKGPDTATSKSQITLGQQAAASCGGAIITAFFMTPLDVIKTRLQAQQRFSNEKISSSIIKIYPNQFSGTLDALVKIPKYEGVTSLWSGLSPTLALSVPATMCYFVSYEQLRLKLRALYNKDRTQNKIHTQPFWIPLLSAGTARAFSLTLVNPLELIRTKMQSEKLSYSEMNEALKLLMKQSGIKGLWKGIVPTFFRDVPFSAIYWMSYESIKSLYGTDHPVMWQSFIGGAISGSIAATVTIPFDVVKTYQQISFGTNKHSGEIKSSRTTSKVLMDIYRYNGLQGFFVGLVPRLIRVAPACAIMISCFEYGKVFFNNMANKKSSTHNLES